VWSAGRLGVSSIVFASRDAEPRKLAVMEILGAKFMLVEGDIEELLNDPVN